MTITPLLINNTNATTAPVENTTATTRIIKLPTRFDVHQVKGFLAEVSTDGARITLDGSAVEMIDMTALRSLAGVAAEFPELMIRRPSVALRATIDCTNNDQLGARLVLAGRNEPARAASPEFFPQAA